MKTYSIGLTDQEFDKLSILAKACGLTDEQMMQKVVVTLLMLDVPDAQPPVLEQKEDLGNEPC